MKAGLRFLWLAIFLAAPWLRAAAPGQPLGDVRYEQRIGQRLPLGTIFTDINGHRRALGDFFHGQPVILFFGYAHCPQLCSVVAGGTVAALRRIQPSAGRDFQVVSISIDPHETQADARERTAELTGWYDRPGTDDGWHYLTGTAAAIRAVTAAAGFHFYYDADSRLYVHPSGFVVVTPKGIISRYFLGVDFTAGKVAAALERAGHGETGRTVYELLLICCRGDWIGGRYGPLIWRILLVSVVLTVAVLGGGIGWMLHEERRGAGARPVEGSP